MGGLLKFIAELSALPLAGLLAAAVLARLALRGRRTDDHLLCRACGYDLYGIAPPAGQRPRCPECGRDVAARSSIVIGHRERRRGLLRLSLAVALLSGLGLAAVGRTIARGLRDPALRPTRWLIHQLDGRPGVTQHEAFDELVLRNDRGELSPAQVRGVANAILVWQDDALANWNFAWGEFVEAAHVKRALADDQWDSYIRQGVVLWLGTRKQVRQGDDPQFVMPLGTNRFSTTPSLMLSYHVTFSIDGVPSTVFHIDPHRLDWGTRSRSGGSLTPPTTRPAAAPPSPPVPSTNPATRLGQHVVQADIEFEVTERAPFANGLGTGPAHRWRKTLRSRFEIVPADRQTVELVRDPAVLADVAQGIKLRDLVFRADLHRLEVSLDVIRLITVDFAADVIVRAGGREWVAHGAVFNAGTLGGTTALAPTPDGFDATRADVIVRGTPAAAARTTDMTRIWGSELLFKDVPVTPSDEMGVPKPQISPTPQPQ